MEYASRGMRMPETRHVTRKPSPMREKGAHLRSVNLNSDLNDRFKYFGNTYFTKTYHDTPAM